jgi:hypothetical protein
MDNKLSENNLFIKIAELIEASRNKVVSAINLTMVYTYYEIGRMIVEDEQKGNSRAEYAKSVIKELSVNLSNKFGRGFSEPNLRNMRKFYLVYSQIQIQQKPSTELLNPNNVLNTIWGKPLAKLPHFTLGWSRYLILQSFLGLTSERIRKEFGN